MNHKKLYLSNSSIKTYLRCKKKFKLKYVDKINQGTSIQSKYMSFGNSIHAALGDFNSITVSEYKTLDVLHKLLRKNWVRDGYDSIEEERTFGKRGLEMLTQYYNDPKDISLENLIVEEMIFKEMKDYVLCGKLDKAYVREDNLIEVTDYKTCRTVTSIDNIQLPLYLILAEEKLGYYPDAVSLYFLAFNSKTVREVNKDFIKESVNYIYKLCETIINETNYEATPDSYCQSNCEFYEMCDEAKDKNVMIIHKLRDLEENEQLDTVF